ncbi:LacI family DNA-binding transcriptional regulator [Flavihumibacter petaseus]|nr:LacI family DNA-binding transcriptional regulator [Flavihumibacter petaseus]
MGLEKDITIYDIADKLGVSPSTVSRALKNHTSIGSATRKKILAAAHDLGYRANTFASNLRRQRTNTLGIMVHELRSSFITSVLSGIENIAAETNYDLIITHSSENAAKEAANAENLFHKRVDGLIASLSFDTKDLNHFRKFFDKGLPVIFFDRVFEQGEGTKVIIDNYRAGYNATSHLIEQGCRRIAHITSSLSRNVYSERFRGYSAALRENNIPYEDNLLVVDSLSEEAAVRSANAILAISPAVDAVFITNDMCAAVVMQVIKEAGLRIPEDIAIIGFNNDMIGKVTNPKLSTIDYPGFQIGQVAARQIIHHLQGITDINMTNTIIINSELVIRGSSLKKQT